MIWFRKNVQTYSNKRNIQLEIITTQIITRQSRALCYISQNSNGFILIKELQLHPVIKRLIYFIYFQFLFYLVEYAEHNAETLIGFPAFFLPVLVTGTTYISKNY